MRKHKNEITVILGRWDNQIGPARTIQKGKKKMFKSPCKLCLVFPICSSICDKKLYFTAERFCRFLRYRKLTAEHGIEDKLISKLMKDTWAENARIGTRINPDHGGGHRYRKQRDKVEDMLKTEHSYQNTKYCHMLMKHCGIERKDYANTV